jgi:hypothetical protein
MQESSGCQVNVENKTTISVDDGCMLNVLAVLDFL